MIIAWLVTIIITIWITHEVTKIGLQRDIDAAQDAAMFCASQIDELTAKIEDPEWEMLDDKLLYTCAGEIQQSRIDEYDEEMVEEVYNGLRSLTYSYHWTEEDLRAYCDKVIEESKMGNNEEGVL